MQKRVLSSSGSQTLMWLDWINGVALLLWRPLALSGALWRSLVALSGALWRSLAPSGALWRSLVVS